MVGSILAATLLAPTEVFSDPGSKTRPAKTYYQGAFWSTQVHVGITSAGDGASVGPALGASFRLASILSLADLQLTVLGAKYMLARKNEAEVRVQRMSLGVAAHVHPLFLFMLRNTRFWYWIAGFHVSLEMDLELTHTKTSQASNLQTDVGWHIGVGTDIPLTDPNRGWSLWLSLNYRYGFLSVDSPLTSRTNFNEHAVLLTLGYRNNNIFGARFPIPSEFDYRKPSVAE